MESAELGDQWPHLAREVNEGFERLKSMIKGLLDKGKEAGELVDEANTEDIADLFFFLNAGRFCSVWHGQINPEPTPNYQFTYRVRGQSSCSGSARNLRMDASC